MLLKSKTLDKIKGIGPKKQMLLQNAITKYVRDVIEHLNQETVEFDMEVEFTNEVPNNAINDNV